MSASSLAVVANFGGGFGILVLAILGGGTYGIVRWRARRSLLQSANKPEATPVALPPGASGDNEAPPSPLPQRGGPGESVPPAAPAPPDVLLPRRRARTVFPDDSEANRWAVETHGLTKRFGPNVAVDDVELLVPQGYAFGCLGPNGAGKTTLIRTLLGLTKPDRGSMSLLGIPVPSERHQALAHVGAIVDEPRFHGHLTGRENLRILAAARGPEAKARIMPSLERVGLAGRADDKVASYSMGMRQRLGVAACLLADPDLLILDEPMNGLDPAGMHDMRSMIESLADEGRTVVLCSHLLDEIERTCDAVAIVDHGHVIRQGPIDELVHGAGALVVSIECSDPTAARACVEQSGIAAGTSLTESGLSVTLPAGSSEETIADIVRLIVGEGISLYGLQRVRTSLEDWFLTVTSRLGGQS